MPTAIVAYNKNFAIAQDGKIPWYLPEDFKHFKETTLGGSIVMGRKTFDALPRKPLPGRTNIVLTRTPFSVEGRDRSVCYTSSFEGVFSFVKSENPNGPVFIIGGEEIFKLAFEEGYIDKVIASEVDDDTPGDRFFPDLLQMGWSKRLIKTGDKFQVFEFLL